MSPIKLNVEGFPSDFNFYNDQFPPLDALTYWHFLKSAKRVVEARGKHMVKKVIKTN